MESCCLECLWHLSNHLVLYHRFLHFRSNRQAHPWRFLCLVSFYMHILMPCTPKNHLSRNRSTIRSDFPKATFLFPFLTHFRQVTSLSFAFPPSPPTILKMSSWKYVDVSVKFWSQIQKEFVLFKHYK